MSYRFNDQEMIPVGIKRITDEQIDSAIYKLTRSIRANRANAIHDARKHFKKLRALVRLVRDEVGHDAYKRENVCFRDAGRKLSDVRDAEVRVETFDTLVAHYQESIDPELFQGIRHVLVEAYEATRKSEGPSEQDIAAIVSDLEAARTRIQSWGIQDDWHALQDSLHRVYKRGYRDFADACENATPEQLHEWRKRVKYLWYHLRILSPIWPKVMKTLKKQTKKLADLLGDDHDLTVLRNFIADDPEAFSDDEQLGVLLALIQRRQLELQTQARFLGQRLYAEKPKAFVARLESYWYAWRSETSQPSVLVSQSSMNDAFECANA
ncbi:MAG: CHAD domain-containing protein [Leptolyngbyaceae bacterium]|nr:CHAD domain-containing protein [Leptolyngbyaceae bacterium]